MKSILLHVEDDDGFEARLQAALYLARVHDAHLTCLQVVNYEIFAPGDFYGAAMAAAVPQIKEAAEEFRKRIEVDLANEDVRWEWQHHSGFATSKLLEKSALNDLIIVGPKDVGQRVNAPSSMVAELALYAKAPVLVVPEKLERFDLEAPVLIAWNSSPEACAALRASVPLLGRTSKVLLASVGEESDREGYDFPPVEGAEYLSRYGIHAELLEVPRDGAKIADVLFSAASSRGCGLVVMGAYGHSRLAEFLLGGVTRRALADPQLPILLAH